MTGPQVQVGEGHVPALHPRRVDEAAGPHLLGDRDGACAGRSPRRRAAGRRRPAGPARRPGRPARPGSALGMRAVSRPGTAREGWPGGHRRRHRRDRPPPGRLRRPDRRAAAPGARARAAACSWPRASASSAVPSPRASGCARCSPSDGGSPGCGRRSSRWTGSTSWSSSPTSLRDVTGYQVHRGALATFERRPLPDAGRARARCRQGRRAGGDGRPDQRRRGVPGGGRPGYGRGPARPALRGPALPPRRAGLDGRGAGAAVRAVRPVAGRAGRRSAPPG